MASITIRNLSEEAKQLLRIKAAQAGMSLEGFVRDFLNREAMKSNEVEPASLLALTQDLFGEEHGVELDLPAREGERELVELGE